MRPRSFVGQAALLGVAAILVLPVVALATSWLDWNAELWQHLWQTTLPGAIGVTAAVVVCATVGATLLGTAAAVATSRWQFPGAGLLSFLLAAPLCLPKYVLAFVFLSLTEYTGPVQTFLRSAIGTDFSALVEQWPELGLTLTYIVALYPYVFLAVSAGLRIQPADQVEAAILMGGRGLPCWRIITLPYVRPFMVGGALIVALEAYADFGAAAIFGVDTVAVVIYKVWASLFSLATAAQIATIALIVVGLLYWLEQRGQSTWGHLHGVSRPIGRRRLAPWKTWMVAIALWSQLALVWLLPVCWIAWLVIAGPQDFVFQHTAVLRSSLMIAGITALVVVVLAMLASQVLRWYPHPSNRWAVHGMRFGYAVPGTSLAIGVLLVTATAENSLRNIGLSLQGSLIVVILALSSRFFILGFNLIRAHYLRIPRQLDEAATLMGAKPWRVLFDIHRPMTTVTLGAAAFFVFIDVLKEMPVTLMTRPFGWDTLSVKVFEYTSEGDWDRAAWPGLLIGLFGFVALILMWRQEAQRRRQDMAAAAQVVHQ